MRVHFLCFLGIVRTPLPITSTFGSPGTTGIMGTIFTSPWHITGKFSSEQSPQPRLSNQFQTALPRTAVHKTKIPDVGAISGLGVLYMYLGCRIFSFFADCFPGAQHAVIILYTHNLGSSWRPCRFLSRCWFSLYLNQGQLEYQAPPREVKMEAQVTSQQVESRAISPTASCLKGSFTSCRALLCPEDSTG